MTQRAVFTVSGGANAGDSLKLERGMCRLVGRHVSEDETIAIDRNGNRMLDANADQLFNHHLHDNPRRAWPAANVKLGVESFQRGPDIIFADESISRAHAMIFFDAAGAGIVDLASTNGTFVNGERVASALLADGDVVRVGNTELGIKLERA